MRGSSRASLASAEERLEALLGAPYADRTAIADGLFAVAALLDQNVTLRRALTDPSQEGEAKAGLANRLLEGKLPGGVVDLVAGLARSRWAQARDLADACEQLAVTALMAAAEAEGRLDRVEDELFRFGRVVNADPQLRSALADRRGSVERRTQLLHQLLADKVAPETLRLARQAVLAARGLNLEAALTHYGQLAARRREQLVAHVLVALPLEEAQRDRLTAALRQMYGRPVHLNVDVNPDVLGGIRVEIGDEVLDGTVGRRLDDARRRLAG
jgi:F-type H+-transporting ATPase subunit delta